MPLRQVLLATAAAAVALSSSAHAGEAVLKYPKTERGPVVDHDPAYTASLEREVADLRKRLEVLERIATDEGETRRLSREIESLRDR